MFNNEFFTTTGSVMGCYHRANFKNNQDAVHIAKSEDGLIAIVCDGCGSGKFSEVGASLASRFIAEKGLELLARRKAGMRFRSGYFEELRVETLLFLRKLASDLGRDMPQIVCDYLLFTVLGALIEEGETTVFTIGDGVFSVNGETASIDQDNTPRYLGYALLPSEAMKTDLNYFDFAVQRKMPTPEVTSIALATDGANDLLDNKDKEIFILGKGEKIGDLTQFEKQEKFAKNPALLQKRLVVLGVNNGILNDDTTVALIRRKLIDS